MTPDQIRQLITARDRLTNRRDEMIDFVAVDQIDAVLSEVKPGTNNAVDLLLGRPCAKLEAQIVTALEREAERQVEVEPHEFYGVSVEDVLREDVRSEVDYPGMWK